MINLADISTFESLQSNTEAIVCNGKIKDKAFAFLTPKKKEVAPITEKIEQIVQKMQAISDEHAELKARLDEYTTALKEARYDDSSRLDTEELRKLINDATTKMLDLQSVWRNLDLAAASLESKKENLLREIQSARNNYDRSPVGYTAGALAGLLRRAIAPKIEAFKSGFSK